MADWALILGASSGFGAAIGRELARAGLDIAGVHLDRRGTQDLVDAATAGIRAHGREALFFNTNAAGDDERKVVLDALVARGAQVRVLVHSLAFGTLKPLVGAAPGESVTRKQLEMTLDVMATSLVYWSQGVVERGLMGAGGRIFAMTSSGGTRQLPQYGPVSAAKAALESYCRQLAMELAPRGIAVNAIRAGVTDTPALRKIPGADRLLSEAAARNPNHRLTTPDDVARCVAALCDERTGWLSGNTLGVDGGEDIVG